jgi:hypothetical protein
MLVVIREGNELSPKAKFVLEQCNELSKSDVLYIMKKGRFSEQWSPNRIDLATSPSGIFTFFLLMFLKSPKDLRDGLIRRIFKTQMKHALINEGFLSILSETLYSYFGTKANTSRLLPYLDSLKSKKIFLVDEFISLKTVDLKQLKRMGRIIYVSQDVAYNRYGFGDNSITKKLMCRLEQEKVAFADLVICCSERDRFKYVEMGAKRVIFYPNIYPTTEFEANNKDETPSICLVLKGYWGSRAKQSLNEVFKALSYIKNKKLRVYLIGIDPPEVTSNIMLYHYTSIPSKTDFLKIMGKSWIGINIGVHMGGTNERKYEYAMSGLIVFSDNFGVRGDLLPYEYSYLDSYDLAAKLKQVLDYGKEKVFRMGKENKEQAILLAETQRQNLLNALHNFNK